MAAHDRLDGAARHQHAAGRDRAGGGLAERLSATWARPMTSWPSSSSVRATCRSAGWDAWTSGADRCRNRGSTATSTLQKKIVARERELGMTPVLQGFTGHVPTALRERFPAGEVPAASELVRVSRHVLRRSGRSAVPADRQGVHRRTDAAVRHRSSVRVGHVHRDVAAEQRSDVPGRHESGGSSGRCRRAIRRRCG